MKPALALEPVHWQGEVVGHIRKFDGRGLLLDAHVRDSVPPLLEFVLEFLLVIRGVEDLRKFGVFLS
jgi:hypothetical protein